MGGAGAFWKRAAKLRKKRKYA